jgi:hypothetical protein
MALSAKVRWLVFQRDNFRCVYCGKGAADAVLEVDHRHPKAAGGTDELDNLATACWDCNHGKADRLEDGRRAGHRAGGRPRKRQEPTRYATCPTRLRLRVIANRMGETYAYVRRFHAGTGWDVPPARPGDEDYPFTEDPRSVLRVHGRRRHRRSATARADGRSSMTPPRAAQRKRRSG